MNFTKAAKKMYISQQGISKIINKLEEELRTPLFYRTSSSLQLTEYGKLFFLKAKILLNDYKKAMEELHSFQKDQSGILRIGIPHGIVNIFPQDFLDHYIKTHPKVAIRLHQYNDIDCEEALLNKNINIGFCVAPLDEELFLIHHQHTENTYFMVGENHPLADLKTIPIEMLKEERFIGFGEKNKGHDTFLRLCDMAGFTPDIAMSTLDMQLILLMCRNNMGIGFYVGPKDCKIPGIRIIPAEHTTWEWTVCIATLKNQYIPDIESSFLQQFSLW
jgi:DNA-binding transcriptional LysR family regulator